MIQGFRVAEVFLGLLVLGDVLDGAFVVEQFALRVADGPHILGDPDHAAILAMDGGFKVRHHVVFLHKAGECFPPAFFDIQFPANVRYALHQFLG